MNADFPSSIQRTSPSHEDTCMACLESFSSHPVSSPKVVVIFAFSFSVSLIMFDYQRAYPSWFQHHHPWHLCHLWWLEVFFVFLRKVSKECYLYCLFFVRVIMFFREKSSTRKNLIKSHEFSWTPMKISSNAILQEAWPTERLPHCDASLSWKKGGGGEATWGQGMGNLWHSSYGLHVIFHGIRWDFMGFEWIWWVWKLGLFFGDSQLLGISPNIIYI